MQPITKMQANALSGRVQPKQQMQQMRPMQVQQGHNKQRSPHVD